MNQKNNMSITISISLIVVLIFVFGYTFSTQAQSNIVVNGEVTPHFELPDNQLIAGSRSISNPIPTPIPNIAEPIISDQQFLTGYPWEASEVQSFLEANDSALAVAIMDPYGDGITMPASEAIASLSGFLTVSPPVLLTFAEMNFGVLSNKLADSEPLTQEELASLSGWMHDLANNLSENYYHIDNLATRSSDGGLLENMVNPIDTSIMGTSLNTASIAIFNHIASPIDETDVSTGSIQTQIQSFVNIYTRYFGSPTSGNIIVSNPVIESANSPDISLSTLPVLYFPWRGADSWNFTGGPHGTNLSSLDFQPTGWGGKNCAPMYVSDRWITSAAGGKVIANTGFQVIIDHDNDGNAATGWQTKYFHVYNIRVTKDQVIPKNTDLGNPSCYGGTADGVHGHFELQYQGKAQAINGTLIGGWRVENGSQAYNGFLKKGNLVRQAGASGKMELISNNCPLNKYYAEYYNSALLDETIYPPNKRGCENVISYEWGGQSPGSPIAADNFSVRWEGEFSGFYGSDFTFAARADDGIRVYLDNQLIINRWIDQGPTAYYSRRAPTSGSHNVKVEYYERGGGATVRVGWCPANYYIVDYYNNRTLSGQPAAWGCQSQVNFNWGTNSPHPSVTPDNFSARWMGLFNFTSGTHHFFATGDDGIRVYVDNSSAINGWKDQGPTEYRATRSLNTGLHSVMVEYYEAGGGAVSALWWSQNAALNRYSVATSVQDSNTYSASKGNDGNNSTRWSSSVISTLLRDQWWIVDLGSRKTFSQVRINWEKAYAAEYAVAWRDDSVCSGTFSGFRYTGNREGWVTHNIGTRTARCLAIVMMKRGPYNNYSFWETEVLSPIFNARSKQAVQTTQNMLYSFEPIIEINDFGIHEDTITTPPLYLEIGIPVGEPVNFEFDTTDIESSYTE